MLNKFKVLLISCMCISCQCFAFNFSKAGAVWAQDCNSVDGARTFARTANGDLTFFSWASPTTPSDLSLLTFKEDGDQISYAVRDWKTEDVFNVDVSLNGGVWTFLQARKNSTPLIKNGLYVDSGRKAPPLRQCSQTSTAYKMTFSKIKQAENQGELAAAYVYWSIEAYTGVCGSDCFEPARKFPVEYQKFKLKLKLDEAKRARAERECRTAGDIDRCIKITMGN